MSFYEDMENALLEAIEMDKGNLPIKERDGMPVTTYYVANDEEEIVDKIIDIRKRENISQTELASKTGVSQQAISRFEQKTHNPSLKLFASIVKELGYEVQFVKRTN